MTDFEQNDENGLDITDKKIHSPHQIEFRDYLNIGSAIITSIATGVIAYYTVRLSNSTEIIERVSSRQADSIDQTLKQNQELIQYSKTQSIASVEQSEAAQIQNLQVEVNSKKQTRAYVVGNKYTDQNFRPLINIKNVGQTPAIGMTIYIRAVITKKPIIQKFLDNNLDTKIIEDDNSRSRSVLGAGDSIDFLGVDANTNKDVDNFLDIDNFSKADIDDFKNRKSVLWVSGLILYKDVFKEYHYTRICFYFDEGSFETRTYCNKNNEME